MAPRGVRLVTPSERRFCSCGATFQWVGEVLVCPLCGEPEPEPEPGP